MHEHSPRATVYGERISRNCIHARGANEAHSGLHSGIDAVDKIGKGRRQFNQGRNFVAQDGSQEDVRYGRTLGAGEPACPGVGDDIDKETEVAHERFRRPLLLDGFFDLGRKNSLREAKALLVRVNSLAHHHVGAGIEQGVDGRGERQIVGWDGCALKVLVAIDREARDLPEAQLWLQLHELLPGEPLVDERHLRESEAKPERLAQPGDVEVGEADVAELAPDDALEAARAHHA
eukprot:scaffold182792_cov26-Tisochrysis_lutea.AAC.1